MENQPTPRQTAGAANGRLAAGAKSPEGRARSAANATKHGLTGKSNQCSVTILNESPDAFDNLCQALANCFLPTDAHEIHLVRRMAEAEWLRQRAIHMEAAALSEAMRQQAYPFHAHTLHANSGAQDLAAPNAESLRAWHAFSKLSSANPAFASLQRYAATHARAYARAERELRDYRTAKAESIHPTPNPVGATTRVELAPNPDALSNTESRWRPLELIEPEPVPAETLPAETLQQAGEQESITDLPANTDTTAAPLTVIAPEQPSETTNGETNISLEPTPIQQNHPNMLN